MSSWEQIVADAESMFSARVLPLPTPCTPTAVVSSWEQIVADAESIFSARILPLPTPCTSTAVVPENIKPCVTCGKNSLQSIECGHFVCSACILERFLDGLESCAVCKPQITTKQYKCSEENCEVMDVEKNLNICSTCTPPKTLEGLEQLISSALCSTCALRKHSKMSHEIIDFSPILVKMQSLSMQNVIRQKNEENLKIIDFARFESFVNMQNQLIEKYTEHLEYCGDSVEQRKIFENLEKHIENSKNARYRMQHLMTNEISHISGNIQTLLRQLSLEEVPAKRVCREKI